MFRVTRVVPVLLLCLSVPASMAAQSAADGYRLPYDIVKGNIIKAAEQVAEANYTFKPTPDVRSFGQLVGHIANANFMICSAASGEKSPATGDAEKLATKAELQKVLADSFAFCDKAWAAVNGPRGAAPVDLFGMKFTGASAMSFNSAHDWEHYGNIVTYMRLKGMVPPSSQGRGMN
ncbi:MAG: DinB family protein [Vicinamibacterales bacterium]